MLKTDDDLFKELINHHRDVWITSNHIIIQILCDKITEISERLSKVEKMIMNDTKDNNT